MFVKHVLKVKRYVRYVDDFVLIGDRPEQLNEWREQIERFLDDGLHLELKPGYAITPLSQGVDFLGYVVFPTHTKVRPRFVAHARTKLNRCGHRHVTPKGPRVTPDDSRQPTSNNAPTPLHLTPPN